MPDDFAHRQLVAAQSEGSYGTDAYSGSDPSEWLARIESDSPVLSEQNQQVTSEVATAVHDTRPATHYPDKLEVEVELPLKGDSSDEDEPPPHAPFLKASNHKEVTRDPDSNTDSGDEYVEYHPVTGDGMSTVPSATIANYLFNSDYSDHYKWLAKGARGNLSWTAEVGNHARVTFSGSALYETQPTSGAASSLAPSAYSGEEESMVVAEATFTIDGTTYPLSSFELESGWNVVEERDAVQATGDLYKVSLARDAGSAPSGSFTLKGRDSAFADLMPLVRNGTTGKIVVELEDPSGSNAMQIVVPAAQMTLDAFNLGDDPSFDIPFMCRGTWDSNNSDPLKSGNNSYFIKWGAPSSSFDQR